MIAVLDRENMVEEFALSLEVSPCQFPIGHSAAFFRVLSLLLVSLLENKVQAQYGLDWFR